MYRVYRTEFTVQSSVGIISTEESDKPNKICGTSCTSCRVSLNDAEYENWTLGNFSSHQESVFSSCRSRDISVRKLDLLIQTYLQFEYISTANIPHCLPINNRHYFIWQFTALLTQTVSRNNTQRRVRRYPGLPWVGVHTFWFNVLRLIWEYLQKGVDSVLLRLADAVRSSVC